MTTSTSSAARPLRLPVIVVAVVFLGVLVAACGSSTRAATTTTTTPSATTASPSASSVSKIEALTSSLQGSERASFKAVYTLVTTGLTETVTVEQSPPKTAFLTKDAEIIDTGTATYYCTESGQTICLSASATNPLASLTELFSPQTALTELRDIQAEAAAAASGYTITFSSGTYGGQSTTCANVSGKGTTEKYCVTKQGILAYGSSPAATLSLTSYSPSPPASDFALPAGATVETIPSELPS
jgi:hypothetical protein